MDHHAPDARWMARALQLAEQAIGLSEPNPRVGCVIVGARGEPLGEGHTQAAGQAHAEVMALRDAAARGASVADATAYVTLEPCAHHGRTPPCCDALIAAGLSRVVIALGDPNPLVGGQGIARLRAAGIAVDTGLLAEAAEALNIGFLTRMRSGRPWVRMKWAASLDARTALPDGRSRWITGAEARLDGQRWRRRAGAVLTGIGTALTDDPRLDVRDLPIARQPLRVLLDRQARLPADARLLQPPGELLQVHGPDARPVATLHWQAPLGADGRLDLPAVLAELGQRGINELHVEAGAQLNGALLAAGLVDELLIYLAPKLLGPGLGVAELPLLPEVDAASRWQWLDSERLGADLRLRLVKTP